QHSPRSRRVVGCGGRRRKGLRGLSPPSFSRRAGEGDASNSNANASARRGKKKSLKPRANLIHTRKEPRDRSRSTMPLDSDNGQRASRSNGGQCEQSSRQGSAGDGESF